jgi:hypothetical protein
MTHSNSEWPQYLPIPSGDVLAVGAISLTYCQLEQVFKVVLSEVARWNDYQVASVFHRLPNNHRLDVFSELLAKTTIPTEVKANAKHFGVAFEICSDNRNLVMHSASGGFFTDRRAGTRGLILERFSKPGNKVECLVTTNELQKLSDEIHTFSMFGSLVATEVRNYATHLGSGHPEDFRVLPATLRGKPPLPIPLNWTIPESPKAHGIPPAALPLISAYRHREI